MTNPSLALVEMAITVGQEAASNGCTLEEGAAASLRDLFDLTVGHALESDASVLDDPRRRRYIHRKAARVARDASIVARRQNRGIISAEIFEEVALDVFADARNAWDRAREMASARPGWEIFREGSLFCLGLPGA
jgi:hypothetical protein